MGPTCIFKRCPVAKRMKIKSADECPNHLVAQWREQDSNQVKLVDDCAPKRTLLILMDLNNRLVGVEKSQEQQRNVLKPLEKLAQITIAQRRHLIDQG